MTQLLLRLGRPNMQSTAQPTWRDYLELCKPRVVLLMLLCALAGMYLASTGTVSTNTFLACRASGWSRVLQPSSTILPMRLLIQRWRVQKIGQSLLAVFNQGAIVFSAITGVVGFGVLWLFVNPLTAWLNLASWVGYGFIYTMFLKRATPQNIVIGGLFGAAPPLFGWTAVTNSIDPGGLLLVLIIFVWTPPHFWALAIERKEEYALVNMPMLPVTHGESFTRLHILLYTILLLVCSLLPFLIGMSGPLYLLGALALGLVFLYWAVVLVRNQNPRAPMATFKYSILYLGVLFSFLLGDHYLTISSLELAPQAAPVQMQKIEV